MQPATSSRAEPETAASALNDARFDLPPFEGRGIDYLICSTPRCGSTLLAYLLRDCGLMGVPHEYLNASTHLPLLARRLGAVGVFGRVRRDAYLERLRRSRTSPNGVFGIKAHYHHLRPFLRAPKFARLVAGARLVRMRRRDRVRQAISYYVSAATNIWSAVDARVLARRPAVEYNGPAIASRLREIEAEEEAYRSLFAERSLTAIEVWYEDLVADADTVCKAVCRYVGVATAHTFRIEQTGLQRLTSERSAEWSERFRAEYPQPP